jgi:hypothetical protein
MEACVGGEAFEITPLAFRVDCIERQGRFSGTRGSREDDKLVTRNIDGEVGEIVLTGTADTEGIAGTGHKRARSGPGLGLGSRGRGRIDVNATIAAVETNLPVGKGKEGVVTSHADILSGMKSGASLADDDGTGGDGLAAKTFYSETLAAAVATVSCRSLTFFMCHDGVLGYLPAWIFWILIRVRA